ncbi:MAG: cobalt ECF transporter T component CbiQ [Candidatus Kuenenia sp.]|nr:cobalt ECF transporter T component CbiQ [Candidatus Kuenenia hertensis]
MGFLHHTFTDRYTQRNNWLTRIDVRVKLIYLLSMLIANLWAKNAYVSLSFLFISFVFLLTINIFPLVMIKNMVLPLLFAFMMLVVKGLHEGENEWISFSVAGYIVALKKEGILGGLQIGGKILGGVSLVILFSLTTTMSQLNAGLKWLRMPNTVLELMSFMYRYIFQLLNEVSAIWYAQRARLGHASWRKAIKSFGVLGGMLIIRAVERAERTSEAMYARGYKGGCILTCHLKPLERNEYICFSGMALFFPFLLYAGNIKIW